MSMVHRIGWLAIGVLGSWSCVADESTWDEESEETEEADAALKPHDRDRSGPASTPNPDCVHACRESLRSCNAACGYWPPGEREECRKLCLEAYFDCYNMCENGDGQGLCLNSADCHGLPGWSNP
jgi:hypothetical protein